MPTEEQITDLKSKIAFMVRAQIPLSEAVEVFRMAYVRQAVELTVTRNRPRGNICEAAKMVNAHRNTFSRHLPPTRQPRRRSIIKVRPNQYVA